MITLFKKILSQKTKRMRFAFAHLITPSIYHTVELLYAFPRPMMIFLSKQLNNNPLVGVEIGVAKGEHAKSILETIPISKLFLVDPFGLFMKKGLKQDKYNGFFDIAEKVLYSYRNKIEFVKKKSLDAIGNIPDELDFVYIDGCHDYEFVKQDLNNYYPKIKKGGIIGGHDFCTDLLGSCRAVVEFSLEHKLKLYGKRLDWWMIKEE